MKKKAKGVKAGVSVTSLRRQQIDCLHRCGGPLW
jgi:hypothetical protein